MENAFPYLEVRRPFILGTAQQKWKATISHHVFDLLHQLGKLTRLYTQNIDGLDFQVVPRDKIVPVHGSLGTVVSWGWHAAAVVKVVMTPGCSA